MPHILSIDFSFEKSSSSLQIGNQIEQFPQIGLNEIFKQNSTKEDPFGSKLKNLNIRNCFQLALRITICDRTHRNR